MINKDDQYKKAKPTIYVEVSFAATYYSYFTFDYSGSFKPRTELFAFFANYILNIETCSLRISACALSSRLAAALSSADAVLD